jgi:hypothetical protein
VVIRRKINIDMTVEAPDFVAAHFGCSGDKFSDGCFPGDEIC